ncbi:homoserine acetyltransferase [Trichoderma citrinoviride]|uniref:Homoserine acetyltransferase n=1 Tax=Trichoderma citrinoviride TaxID=58853 RepID=A0A2T4AYJ0_9HYPO|nr:homoserine acetyltransferase [Trichoderma citrinoviride]PTB62048.1 homoserine acetyltransferase [Trichoderma citrinoviride]
MGSELDYSVFQLGDFKLVSGQTLPNAFIAYKTFGDASSPAIIYPSWFSGAISDNEWLIGEDKALDPRRYFIIVPALFGNGQSSSPSNTPRPSPLKPFPNITVKDNVTAQHRLITEHLGVKHARMVLGWSMGAGQTYQWLTQYPDFMDLGVPFCGSARTSLHNQVFLEGVKSALLAAKGAASAGSAAGESAPMYRAWTEEERVVGLKAFGRVYAGWGFSQVFYRDKVYETELGYKNLEDFMVNFWESWALAKDPENLLTMLHTWQAADCSDQEPYNKNLELAMKSIKAKTLVLPGKTDLYFPPEDSEYEVQHMMEGVGQCIPFPSIWGHWAGGPGVSKEDMKWLDGQLKALLDDKKWQLNTTGLQ